VESINNKNNENSKNNNGHRFSWGFALPLLIAVILLLGVLGLYFTTFGSYHFKMPRIDEWGTIGDFVGGLLNPAFSFIALIFLFFTIRIQSEELKQSTKELAISGKALTEQSNTLKLQQFENTFFQLLNLLANTRDRVFFEKEICESIEDPESSGESIDLPKTIGGKGHSAFQAMLNELSSHYFFRATKSTLDHGLICEAYEVMERDLTAIFGHYFRLVYNILKFIDKEDISNERKPTYINILRAQLSEHELSLIFYDAWYFSEKLKRPKFKELIIKYAVLEDINKHTLLVPEHINLYPPAAYGK
jgi:uncharacterized membrane protein